MDFDFTDPTDYLEWAAEKLYMGLGVEGEPEDQMVWSAILALTAYLASPIGLFVTVFIGLIFSVLFVIGTVRFVLKVMT